MEKFNEITLREYLLNKREDVRLLKDGIELRITGESLRSFFDFCDKYKGILHRKVKPVLEAIGWEYIGHSGKLTEEEYCIKLIEKDINYKELNEKWETFSWYAALVDNWESMTNITSEDIENFCKETVLAEHGVTEEVLEEVGKLKEGWRLLGSWWVS